MEERYVFLLFPWEEMDFYWEEINWEETPK